MLCDQDKDPDCLKITADRKTKTNKTEADLYQFHGASSVGREQISI